MKRTLIHNATIVNEGRSVQGSVVIENGVDLWQRTVRPL